MNDNNIILFGNSNDEEFILIEKLMRSGYNLKGYDGEFIGSHAYLELEQSYRNTLCLRKFLNKEKVEKLITDCSTVICCDYLHSRSKLSATLSYGNLKMIVDISKCLGVKKLLYISYLNLYFDHEHANGTNNYSTYPLEKYENKIKNFEEYLIETDSSDFIALTITPEIKQYNHPVKKVKIRTNIIKSHTINKSELIIRNPWMKVKTFCEHIAIKDGYMWKKYRKHTVSDNQNQICTNLIKYPLYKTLNIKLSIVIRMVLFIKYIRNIIKIPHTLFRYKNTLIRLKDVLIMMILFHVYPKLTYRFSTRNLLPNKNNRYTKVSKPTIPYDLLSSKCSKIKKMKEINIIGRGASFDMDDLETINGPIFLISHWSPINLKDNRISYVIGRRKVVKLLKEMGNKVISVEVYGIDQEGEPFPLQKDWGTETFLELYDDNYCTRVAISENVYRPPLMPPQAQWTPHGSFLPALCALSFFAEKINIYGWDFYLESSPSEMSYWELFFNLYKYKLDSRSKNHFESALINFYYGYKLSSLPNINNYGYMGHLNKHKKLIKRIENVLFN